MQTRARPLAAALLVIAAGAVFTAGCGATIYDAVGVPKLACSAEKPLSCGFTCLPASAEADSQCGVSCLDCTGANKQSADAVAANFCNLNDPDLTLHACDFSCPPDMTKNTQDNRCACLGTQARCGGTSCADQAPQRCGDDNACVDCSARVVPAHSVGACNLASRQCDFACDQASGFVKNAQGDACSCQDATKVTCGAGGACVPETTTACSDQCVNCADPALRTVNVDRGSVGCSAHACTFSCPPFADVTLTRPCLTANQHDCCKPCAPGQNTCADGCFARDTPTHCGIACTDCSVPAITPAGATPACVSNGSTANPDFVCDFTCPAGSFKTVNPTQNRCSHIARADLGVVALGAKHTCAIVDDGTVRCWGANDQGQLGDGTRNDSSVPVVVNGLPAGVAPSAIAAGAAHTCAVLSSGAVYCWGANGSLQLGNKNVVAAFSATPVPVLGSAGSGTAPFLAAITVGATIGGTIAAGASHTCAIISGAVADVYCWGANASAQLGDPAALAAFTGSPMKVPDITNVSQIAAGGDHACALSAGSVKCWGANDFGQVGNGTSGLPVAPPATVLLTTAPQPPGVSTTAPMTGATSITAGRAHSCATIFNGITSGVSCWGSNALWQLVLSSNGTPPLMSTASDPVLSGIKKADMLAAGDAHACGFNVTDTIGKCQGLAFELGDATVLNPLTDGAALDVPPVPPFLGALPRRVYGGGDHSCFLEEAAVVGFFELQCWGSNDRGQVGLGSTTPALLPAPISAVHAQ